MVGRLEFKTKRNLKWFGMVPLFDPKEGQTVVDPPGSGRGWWAGAPSVIYDDQKDRFLLFYRLRKPRELGRGFKCCIAESVDGASFSVIWEGTKEELQSPSLERASIFKNLDGSYSLYISYVDPKDLRWRMDYLHAESADEFDLRRRFKIFTAEDIHVEGVKDPYVFLLSGIYYMFISYVPTPPKVDNELKKRMHETADVFNTGISKSHTALAVSKDGRSFKWLGDILSPKTGWDGYATRIGCILPAPPVLAVFYDGSAAVEENYEEKTGLAFTFDLMRYERVSVERPFLTSPNSSGSLRYLDAIELDGKIYYYYEYAREDGSHELRMNRVNL